MAGLRRQEAEGGTPERKSDYIPACAEGRMSGDRDHGLAVPLCVCSSCWGSAVSDQNGEDDCLDFTSAFCFHCGSLGKSVEHSEPQFLLL